MKREKAQQKKEKVAAQKSKFLDVRSDMIFE